MGHTKDITFRNDRESRGSICDAMLTDHHLACFAGEVHVSHMRHIQLVVGSLGEVVGLLSVQPGARRLSDRGHESKVMRRVRLGVGWKT